MNLSLTIFVKDVSKPMSDEVLSIMDMAKLSSLIPMGSPAARKEYPQLVNVHHKTRRAIPQKKGKKRY
jgi:hypothetical protein